MFDFTYRNRSVLVTGHTGFKGGWLSQWLLNLGAKVHGIALAPEPHETLYDQLSFSGKLASESLSDIRDFEGVKRYIDRVKPEILFHLAAQPLVRRSFVEPKLTFETNFMGTLNVLETVRLLNAECTVIVVTTDKCYENREWLSAYREDDPLGGFDPYSASKACAELVASAYRRSFFQNGSMPKVATARAGNVIGGGDWAVDRIVPDIFRALQQNEPVQVRNKSSTRPWQHVLDPLSGYLWLASRLFSLKEGGRRSELCSAFNFGPGLGSNRTVQDLVLEVLKHESGTWKDCACTNAPHEASKLNLAVEKAFHLLSWQPTWEFDSAVQKTVEWYRRNSEGGDMAAFTNQQISEFEQLALLSGHRWAMSSASGSS